MTPDPTRLDIARSLVAELERLGCRVEIRTELGIVGSDEAQAAAARLTDQLTEYRHEIVLVAEERERRVRPPLGRVLIFKVQR